MMQCTPCSKHLAVLCAHSADDAVYDAFHFLSEMPCCPNHWACLQLQVNMLISSLFSSWFTKAESLQGLIHFSGVLY